ncbi:hypothetical protein M1247_00240 [Mycobacterium sp. 21AC1]|uniref:EspA/EspE family type VII secretion system effector n=1 Tax=[Mycobacterium] appelbergii TaxID=2939269 RepID=UPI002938D28D|nr:EspA/EspE family type VII secretion system effector [Mycobacterium sp. 21AC1]MDV3123330.1 hypothetical protein [Mycobacterium sp. 21AC1]
MGLLGDIADLGKDVVEDRDKWADRFKKVGDLIERNAKGDKLAQVAKVGRKLADFGKKFTDFFESGLGKRLIKSAKSPILAAGQHVIDGMKLSTGVGDPDNGERFGQGADRLGEAGTTLTAAFPTGDWDSSGAGAYTGRNNEQVGRTQTLADADQLVASVLSREAGQIATTRENLDSQSDWLGDMSLVTMATGLIPYVGKAAQVAAEIAMVAKAVGESGDQLMTMQQNAGANAAELQGAVSRYAAVAQTAEPTGSDGEFAAPPGSDEEPDDAPGVAGAPGEDEAPVTGGPSAPSSGAPSGGGGSGPSGGGAPSGGAMPSAPMPATPAAAAGMSTPPQPAGTGSGAEMAGVLAGAMGSVLGSLGGLVGGVVQAAAQAAQVATQTATQAAQGSGGSADPAAADLAADRTDKPDELDKQSTEDQDDPTERDAAGADRKAGDDAAGDEKPPPVSDDESDAGPAKTLPPDLQAAAAGGGGAGNAPVFVGANFEQRQLHAPETVKLDAGIPGSAAVARA